MLRQYNLKRSVMKIAQSLKLVATIEHAKASSCTYNKTTLQVGTDSFSPTCRVDLHKILNGRVRNRIRSGMR